MLCKDLGYYGDVLIPLFQYYAAMLDRPHFADSFSRISGLYLVASLCSCAVHGESVGGGIHLFFSVREELPAETFVGDLVRNSLLETKHTPDVLRTLGFVFLRQTPHSELFSLDSGGILRTRAVIDRDVICPGLWTCVVKLDLAVQPAAFFEVGHRRLASKL